jgi:hypothetical protein
MDLDQFRFRDIGLMNGTGYHDHPMALFAQPMGHRFLIGCDSRSPGFFGKFLMNQTYS